MAIELTSAAPSFDDPLGLLSACHSRISAQCATLIHLSDHLKKHGSDSQAKQASTKILNYFNTAGSHHHQDEEFDLFPVLTSIATSDGDSTIIEAIQTILEEHTQLESLWHPLASRLTLIANSYKTNLENLPVESFVNLQRSHIIKEDDLIFTFARQKLSPAQIVLLGMRMANRRNISITKK
ncbi:hemerythrin domain-containing protein [Sulfurirhabdus autotrophica]|uniref:Hemerythrin HHE cation binding domain-containing protein n=1 Tax=Sulfurirhabdus autotrophica TaxID=1706046 RepID=A0A4R3Y4K1_9PROT|nr:hemerythrin domain-containing protein [Sulfurirhabdus autotrophica]TCV86696.1 hemerythrin HHE cation binding domain-containing protein [Sulfurirhabdus autotrophica]